MARVLISKQVHAISQCVVDVIRAVLSTTLVAMISQDIGLISRGR